MLAQSRRQCGEKGFSSPKVTAKVAAWARGERPGGLSEREVEVLRLVAEGLSSKEIAGRLQVKERTADGSLQVEPVDFHSGRAA